MSGPAETDPAVIAPPDPADRPPRLRWRMIPTAGCGVFGLLFVVFGVMGVVALSLLPDGDARLIMRRAFPQTIANASGGLLWLVSAPLWWRGRWGWAAGLSLLGLSFFVAGIWLRP
ncbi:hypothetical protein [Alienimonas sp. DA493]|uniref:hypothetical protein n=1 Tax=Alienimonas sp. DA493 TaxID=3373605 RepID=UPI003754E81E